MDDKTEQALTDALIDQIESAAWVSFRRHQRSIKGQILTAADNYDWHLLHAAYQAGIHAQLAEAQAALKTVMRNAELSKEPCSPDPESPAAVRNAKFASLASVAAQGLGMVSGPSLTAQLAEAQAAQTINQYPPITTEMIYQHVQTNQARHFLRVSWKDGIDIEEPTHSVEYLLHAYADAAREGWSSPEEVRTLRAAIDAAKGER